MSEKLVRDRIVGPEEMLSLPVAKLYGGVGELEATRATATGDRTEGGRA